MVTSPRATAPAGSRGHGEGHGGEGVGWRVRLGFSGLRRSVFVCLFVRFRFAWWCVWFPGKRGDMKSKPDWHLLVFVGFQSTLLLVAWFLFVLLLFGSIASRLDPGRLAGPFCSRLSFGQDVYGQS